MIVKPKKHLGQHFLNDKNIANEIVEALSGESKKVLEIGAGTGVLTEFLIKHNEYETFLIDIDTESIAYLKDFYPELYRENKILEGDFLQLDLNNIFNITPPSLQGVEQKVPLLHKEGLGVVLEENTSEKFAIIGNFPYNISSQIFFKVLENKELVTEVVCMLQKEVAERIASAPGKKAYGILSVFLQAFYDIKYLFTVEPHVFTPPPKVKSGVISLKRNNVEKLDCDEKKFKEIVKLAFNQRRKTLRNALKSAIISPEFNKLEILDKRAEQLSVAQFVTLTQMIVAQEKV